MSTYSRNLEITISTPSGAPATRSRRFYIASFLILVVGFIHLKFDSWEVIQWNGNKSLLRRSGEIKLSLSQQITDENENSPSAGANETDLYAIQEPTKSPSLSPTKKTTPKSTSLPPTKPISSTAALTKIPPFDCQGITPITKTNDTSPKYLIWYPRAGMGNVLVSYISSVMYSCLTGRILKIAPYATRDTGVFDCAKYYNADSIGSICHDLEMDDELRSKYESSHVRIKSPEAWASDHCPRTKHDLEYFLCDDGLSDDEFIAVSSCQYWGDLFFANPHFKTRLSIDSFGEALRARLKPSVKVEEKMVRDGPYHVCIHVRWDHDKTAKSLGNDWVDNLGTCVRNLFARQDSSAKREVLLFTMHEDVRQVIQSSLEDGSGEQHKVRFASEVTPTGGGGHSSDKYQGVADMFSMGQQCLHLLPSMKSSTYFLIGANLMDNVRVFPGEQWKDECLEGSDVTQLIPEGDFWSNEMNGDVCKIRDIECKVKEDLLSEASPNESFRKEADASATVQFGEDASADEVAQTSDLGHEPIHDDKCKRMFEWSMLDSWQSDGKDFDLNNLPQTKRLKISRMGGPSAVGTLSMQIEVRNRAFDLTVVDTTIGMKDLKSPNVWHRYTALYGTWVGVQIATRKYNLVTNRTVYVHDCHGDLPLEWLDLGEISCDRSLIRLADVVIVPPVDGLMWDLAWDFDFQCEDSEMFKAFASLFVDKSSKLDPTDAMGCWISREGATHGTVTNLDEILNMMRDVFPRVKVLEFNSMLTTKENVDMLRECRVLFGNHGAGHTNAIYARPGVSVVEIIGKSKPAYYRNINMLLNQNYESIIGDPTREISDPDFTIDLGEAQAALIRARDHASAWIEKHGYWR
ncbi:hypothetical protein ACHAWX_006830 [Stephanocyclus meneghinianus]